MKRIAILVSSPAEQRRALTNEEPRRDYEELAAALDADVVDTARAWREVGVVSRMTGRMLGRGAIPALWAFVHRHRYRAFISDSERIGLPLAFLLKVSGAQNHHIMVGHWLSPFKKAAPLKFLRLYSHIHHIACRINTQREVAVRLGVPPDRLAVIPKGIDHVFWQPLDVAPSDLVCASGLERRDYGTLVEAVRDTQFKVMITASSPWFDWSGLNRHIRLPANVKLGKLDFVQLRDLYARSRAVVVPLFDLDFQAGITVVLEAMAMKKPVIVSATRGQLGAGLVRDGENGLFVSPGDPRALRAAISYLWEHPDEAARMGAAGRRLVEDGYTIDHFVRHISGLVASFSPDPEPASRIRMRNA